MRHFKILRTFVGPFPMDRIVPESDFMSVEGCDINHLINTSSIEEINQELTEEVLDVGPYNSGGKFYPEVPLPSDEVVAEEFQVEEVQEISTDEVVQATVEESQPEMIPPATRKKGKLR